MPYITVGQENSANIDIYYGVFQAKDLTNCSLSTIRVKINLKFADEKNIYRKLPLLDSTYKFKVIGCLTVVVLLKIKERFWKTYNPLTEASTSSDITLTFKRNLEAHFRDLLAGKCDHMNQVQDYAQAQYLHPSYFSTVNIRGAMRKFYLIHFR
jgi:hypothetical protein